MHSNIGHHFIGPFKKYFPLKLRIDLIFQILEETSNWNAFFLLLFLTQMATDVLIVVVFVLTEFNWNICWKLVELGNSPAYNGPQEIDWTMSVMKRFKGETRSHIASTACHGLFNNVQAAKRRGCINIYYHSNLMFKQTTEKLFKTEIEIVTRLLTCSRLSSLIPDYIVSISFQLFFFSLAKWITSIEVILDVCFIWQKVETAR